MTIKFINREEELAYMSEVEAKGVFRFISIIGRRRVGKTALIEEFMKNKANSLYFLVQDLDDFSIRLDFAKRLHLKFNLSFIGIPSWDDILKAIFEYSVENKIVLVLDEFQRFLRINKSFPSILQGYIDRYSKNSKMFLVVLGSSIGMMHKLFDYSAPLYGRRTGQIFLNPLEFKQMHKWFPKSSIEELIMIYSVFGGTPKYLLDVDPNKSIFENISYNLLSKRGILYNEPEILIKTELPQPATFFNLLRYMAEGKTKPVELSNLLTIKHTSVGYFLNILINDLAMAKREIPITEKHPERSKKVSYSISDNFFLFWFKYIFPNKSDIEVDNIEYVKKRIKNELNQYIGGAFEGICKEFLISMNNTQQLPLIFEKIGRWWCKESEIDIVCTAKSDKQILFCEVKWKDNVDAGKILSALKEKSKEVDWFNKQRKEYYCIIAKSFKDKKKIKEKDVMLFDLKDLEKVLR